MTYRVYRVPSVTCALHQPVRAEEGEETLTHYMRSYFVVAASAEDALEVVREDVRQDAATLLDAEAPEERPAREVPVGLVTRWTLAKQRGVCWKSGRTFFPAA
jgi:hypothetical protein